MIVTTHPLWVQVALDVLEMDSLPKEPPLEGLCGACGWGSRCTHDGLLRERSNGSHRCSGCGFLTHGGALAGEESCPECGRIGHPLERGYILSHGSLGSKEESE